MGAFRSRHQKADPAYDLLPPEPVSHAARPVRKPMLDVVDAEFVVVGDGPKRRFDARSYNDNLRREFHAAQAKAGGTTPPGLIGAVEKVLARMPSDLFSALVALVFVLVFGFAGGFALVSDSGAPSAPVVPTELEITHISLTPQDANGMPVLLINGIVENNTPRLRKISRIRAEFRIDGRLVASMQITPPVSEIEAGRSHGFSAKLRHPGGKMPDVRLSFTETDASGS